MNERPTDLELKKDALALLISNLPGDATVEEMEEIANNVVREIGTSWNEHRKPQPA